MSPMRKECRVQKECVIRHWRVRQLRYDFVRLHLYTILTLDLDGWPHMTDHPNYLTWLDIVYEAKDRGLYSVKTANCDVIASLYHKAVDVILQA